MTSLFGYARVKGQIGNYTLKFFCWLGSYNFSRIRFKCSLVICEYVVKILCRAVNGFRLLHTTSISVTNSLYAPYDSSKTSYDM